MSPLKSFKPGGTPPALTPAEREEQRKEFARSFGLRETATWEQIADAQARCAIRREELQAARDDQVTNEREETGRTAAEALGLPVIYTFRKGGH
jgi:hypothetical protein